MWGEFLIRLLFFCFFSFLVFVLLVCFYFILFCTWKHQSFWLNFLHLSLSEFPKTWQDNSSCFSINNQNFLVSFDFMSKNLKDGQLYILIKKCHQADLFIKRVLVWMETHHYTILSNIEFYWICFQYNVKEICSWRSSHNVY